MPKTKRELDLKDFPPGTVTEFTTLVCLACIFDIFTKQLQLAPRTAFSEIKRHTPTIEELTSRNAMRPYFDSDEKSPHCPYCGSAKRWLARFDTYVIEGGKTTDAARRARAELKDRLKRGGTNLKQVLTDAETDEVLGKMKVSALLEALPKVGKVKAQEIMTELEIAPTRRLRGLGDRQRKALLEKFDFS